MFFETGGIDLSGPTPVNPPPPVPSTQPRQPATGVSATDYIEIDDEEETSTPSRPLQDIDEDEALARRLMQEEVDRSGTGDDTGVRSPIPQRNDILVDPSTDYFTPSYGYGGGYPSRGRGSVLLDTIITVGSTSRGIFNQGTPSIWNADDPTSSLADATGGSSEMSDKANRLARMYRPPFEIMNRATLEEVFILSHEAHP